MSCSIKEIDDCGRIDLVVSSIAGYELERETGNLYDYIISRTEKSLIITVLKKTRYNQSLTSRRLGMSRGTLRKKMKNYGLLY